MTTDDAKALLHHKMYVEFCTKEFLRFFPRFAGHESYISAWYENAIKTGTINNDYWQLYSELHEKTKAEK